MTETRTNRISTTYHCNNLRTILTLPNPKANFELKPSFRLRYLELFFRNFKTTSGIPSHIFQNLSLKRSETTRLRQRNACDYACLGRMRHYLIGAEEIFKYGPTIKTCNTFDNRKNQSSTTRCLQNSLNIILRFTINQAIRITNLISCRGHQS